MKTNIERQLRSLLIKGGKVKMKFIETVTSEPIEEGGESIISSNEYTVSSKQVPHMNLTTSMTKLRKLALKSLNITADSKQLPEWDVNKIVISGDLILRQSRIVMTLVKKSNWTEGESEIDTPQITMYGESKFEDVAQLTKIVEDVIAEAWSYLQGDYYKETGQLALFPSEKIWHELHELDNAVSES